MFSSQCCCLRPLKVIWVVRWLLIPFLFNNCCRILTVLLDRHVERVSRRMVQYVALIDPLVFKVFSNNGFSSMIMNSQILMENYFHSAIWLMLLWYWLRAYRLFSFPALTYQISKIWRAYVCLVSKSFHIKVIHRNQAFIVADNVCTTKQLSLAHA